MASNGLPTLRGRGSADAFHAAGPKPRGRQMTIMQEEQQKLQEAANATIRNLSQLLEEKSQAIERYREKIEDLQVPPWACVCVCVCVCCVLCVCVTCVLCLIPSVSTTDL